MCAAFLNLLLSGNTHRELREAILCLDHQEQSRSEAVNVALGDEPVFERLEGAERRDAAQTSARAKLQPMCWGGILKKDGSCCEPGFTIGKVHFKNKFCGHCCEGIELPLAHIRALPKDLQPYFSNPHSVGFWGTAAASVGGGEVRLINQTNSCDGPMLVIYRHEPPTLRWAAMPTAWASEDNTIRLVIAKQTLVPKEAMSPPRNKRSCEISSASMTKRYRTGGPGVDKQQTFQISHMDPPIAPHGSTDMEMEIKLAEFAMMLVRGGIFREGNPNMDMPPAQTAEELASRLTAAHERLVAILQASLMPASPVLSTLTEEQTAWLRLQLNATRFALQATPTLGERVTAASSKAEAELPHSLEAKSSPEPTAKQRSRSGPSKLNVPSSTPFSSSQACCLVAHQACQLEGGSVPGKAEATPSECPTPSVRQ